MTGRPSSRAAIAAATASCAMPSLEPKPPPTIGREQADLLRLDAEGVGELVAVVLEHLVAAAQLQAVAVPGGDGGVRLHRRAGVRPGVR